MRIPGLESNNILSQEVFLMPLGDDRFKVGATYRWDDLSQLITPEARRELLAKLQTFVSAHIEITAQQAGIRPTMHDRKPVAGLHPDHPQIGILNGLGSKGALLGPYIARQLAEFIAGISTTLDPEIRFERFFKKR